MTIHNHISKINNQIKHLKKDLGIFFTPPWVVDFMINLINKKKLNNDSKILEPACGICQFLHKINETKEKIGVEINKEVIEYINNHNLNKNIKIIHNDFLLWETNEKFDLIIGNPPYGIPSTSKHYKIKIDNNTKNKYKKLYETWYGKYNVYGAFIEKSIKLLKENGELIFIIPATFMILDEFKKLRKFLSENGKTEIIYMGSEIFKPEANITTVILKFTKLEKNKLILYDKNISNIVTINNNWNGEIILFSTEFTNKINSICSLNIGDIYDIRISPRTPEIKNNSDIIKSNINNNLLPILNGKNLKIGKITYEPLSGYFIEKNKKTKLKKFFDKPHIVVGLGFRGDKQLGAAYDDKAYPWMGEVYHLLKKETLINKDFKLSDKEIVNFLNSDITKKYLNDVFRDITYHFNITQLKSIPLPKNKKELKKLKDLL
jgi:adenine-specific DNA-methyltransferase